MTPNPAQNRPRYLNLKQASEAIATPVPTLRAWLRDGRLRGYKPGRSVLVLASDLDELMAAHELSALRAEKARGARLECVRRMRGAK
jgi:excisionase family DNA binding protein